MTMFIQVSPELVERVRFTRSRRSLTLNNIRFSIDHSTLLALKDLLFPLSHRLTTWELYENTDLSIGDYHLILTKVRLLPSKDKISIEYFHHITKSLLY